MASKAPYFPFYPKDFAADQHVEMMSTSGVGAYILLLCKAWHQEPPASLPDDDRVLSRFARMSRDEWSEVRDEVLAAFTLGSDGRLHQKRLRREYDAYKAKSKSATESAKKRWEKERSMRTQNESNANALPTHCEGNARASGSGSNSGSNSSTSKTKAVNSAEKSRGSPEIPKILQTPAFTRAWERWHGYRREAKLKKWTPTTRKTQLKKLAEIGEHHAIECLEHSIANGYQGLFPDRFGGQGPGTTGQTPQARADARRAEQRRGEYPQDAELTL